MVLNPESEPGERAAEQLRQYRNSSGFSAEHLGHLMSCPSLCTRMHYLKPTQPNCVALYYYIRIKNQIVIPKNNDFWDEQTALCTKHT